MAAQPAPRSSVPSSSRANDNSSTLARQRSLPEGPCNYRDLNAGPKPPGCGCRRFWWNGDVFFTAVEETNRQSQDQERNPWCVCGHHACFHDLVERFARGGTSNLESSPASMAPPPAPEADRRGWNKPLQSIAASQRVGLRALDQFQHGSVFGTPERGDRSQQATGQHSARPSAPQHDGILQTTHQDSVEPHDITPSDASGAPLSSLPSFHINSSELRAFNGYSIRQIAQPQGTTHAETVSTIPHAYNGLGLTLYERSMRQAGRQASPSPTVADGGSAHDEVPPSDSQYLPSTRQASSDVAPRNISPNPGFLQRVLESRRIGPPLDLTSLVHTANAEDFIQSATEIATPSAGNTPDFRGLNQLVQDARGLIDTVTRADVIPQAPSEVSPEQVAAIKDCHVDEPGLSRPLPLADQSGSIQTTIQNMPGALQQLVPLLSSLHGYLSRNPDISIHESIHSLSRRIDSLENASFSHVPPEQVYEQFDAVDGRLVELETRVDDHGRIIAAFDPENSNQEHHLQKLIPGDNTSFSSNHSGKDLGSNRVDTERRLRDVEERLDDLEKVQLPSLAHPWEIEVVLIPWGRDLKGIWYPTDELLKPGMTQDSEPWTQAQSMRSRASVSLSAARESGWSSQAIHDWADNTEHWLSPKACGTNGVVFHRLRSRGLVRKVTLHSPGARDSQAAICKAFGDHLETITGSPELDEASPDAQASLAGKLGLSAPFIPLRKVHKSSRLRFLAPSDLVSPALWTADFLASGVLMRAPAGQKRLFITTREAYIQQSTDASQSWTWDRLRGLVRVPHPDSKQHEDAASDDTGADVLEPCWANHPALDPPLSVHSSFASHHSASFHDPSDDEEPAQSEESDQEQEDSPMFQPITPTSEFPTQRSLRHGRARTVSVPLDASLVRELEVPLQQRSFPQQPKRRIRSFEQPNNPDLIAKLPTFIPSPSKTRSRLSKRRRLTRSRSPSGSQPSHSVISVDVDSEEVIRHLRERIPSGESLKPLSAFTPRWSKEPPSPFIYEGSADGGASLSVSQSTGYAAVTRTDKRGITPSAYATPFSGTVNARAGGENEDSGDEDVWGGVEEQTAGATVEDDDMMDDEGHGEDEEQGDEDEESDFSMDEGDENDYDDEALSQEELQLEYFQ